MTNEVKRYNLVKKRLNELQRTAEMLEVESGPYVAYSDYAALLDTLKQVREKLKGHYCNILERGDSDCDICEALTLIDAQIGGEDEV